MIRRNKPIPKRGPKYRERRKRTAAARRARKTDNALRVYGPPARREWMRWQSCLGCGRVGASVSAHIENEGKGRKAHYSKTIPLCDGRQFFGPQGCHQRFDAYERVNGFKRGEAAPQRLAAETEQHWQDHCRVVAIDPETGKPL